MAKEQKTYTKEFKEEAVRLVQQGVKSQVQIARDLGIGDSTLSHWRQQMETHGMGAFPGSGHQHPLEEENRRLRRENEILRQERDIGSQKLSASFRTRSREVPVHRGPSGNIPD